MALTTQNVLDAAIATLDEVGLVDLTMRRLGDVLGVRAGAIYYHVPSKQALLALIADAFLSAVPEPKGKPREALRAWAFELRATLLAHRDSAEIVSSARAMGLLRTDPLLHPAALVTQHAGESEEGRRAAATLLTFVLGHVVEEQARDMWERFGSPEQGRAASSTEETFAMGVDLIVAGIASRFPL